MSASIVLNPAAEPEVVWPGHAAVDRVGARIAHDMLIELERIDKDAHGLVAAEYCQLANSWRQGRPFRNIVAEYVATAQGKGPAELAGFSVFLSDFFAECSQGCAPDAGIYDRFCGDEESST